MLQDAIWGNTIPYLPCPKTRKENIDCRMVLYKKFTGDKSIAAYINVGAGSMSAGIDKGKKLFKRGLNLKAKTKALEIDSVMNRFIQQGVPVIHV